MVQLAQKRLVGYVSIPLAADVNTGTRPWVEIGWGSGSGVVEAPWAMLFNDQIHTVWDVRFIGHSTVDTGCGVDRPVLIILPRFVLDAIAP
jgi:hypothetical protein